MTYYRQPNRILAMLFLCTAWSAIFLQPLDAAIVVGVTTEDADYRDDFSGTAFPTGWQYLWNQPTGWVAGGSSGASATNSVESGVGSFSPLIWENTVSRWTPDGDAPGSGNNQPSGFGQLSANGGHPALGSTQSGSVGNTLDRYVVAAYTLTQGGEYDLINSFIDRGVTGGTVDARVFVTSGASTSEVGSAVTSDGSSVGFNRSLNVLKSGDTVYVAAGPDGSAGSDGFAWDFTIQQTKIDVSGAQTESDTDIRLIEEETVTLASELAVDRASPVGLVGTFGPGASAGTQSIAAGTEVTSYLLHFDPLTDGGVVATGMYTFDEEIVGLIFQTEKLDASDSLLGLTDIIYPTEGSAQPTGFRGSLNEATDELIISADRRTIDLTLFAGSGGSVDQLRILTAQSVPEPSSLVMLALATLGLTAACDRRRRRAAL